MPNDLDNMLNALVPIVRPIVEHIEASVPATKDRYDAYMAAIAKLYEMVGNKNDDLRAKTYLALGVVLQRAGANKTGVQAALRVMGAI